MFKGAVHCKQKHKLRNYLNTSHSSPPKLELNSNQTVLVFFGEKKTTRFRVSSGSLRGSAKIPWEAALAGFLTCLKQETAEVQWETPSSLKTPSKHKGAGDRTNWKMGVRKRCSMTNFQTKTPKFVAESYFLAKTSFQLNLKISGEKRILFRNKQTPLFFYSKKKSSSWESEDHGMNCLDLVLYWK